MTKLRKTNRLMMITFTLICSALVANAQTTTECFKRYPDIEEAKNTIFKILNNKSISAYYKNGEKIRYNEAKVFDDRIELITKKGNEVFYFRDIMYPKTEVELTIHKEHIPKGESFLKEHDNYNCSIENVGYPKFSDSYKIFEDNSSWGDPNSIRYFAEALSSFQHELAKVYTDSINNNVDQKLKNNLIEFQETAKVYNELTEKPSVTEEQRKYIVQANALNEEKKYREALEFYEKVIKIQPTSYPSAYYNMALIAAQIKDYWYAILNMKKYMMLVPESPDARAAQDKIYEWEAEIEK